MAEARIEGKAATLEAAARHGAELLAQARLPVVAGLGADVAGASAAILLAERLRGAYDHLRSREIFVDLDVVRQAGAMVTTPYVARQHADVLLFIGDDITAIWPDLPERLKLASPPALALAPAARTLVWIAPPHGAAIAGVAMADMSVINTGASRPSVRINVDAQSMWALKAVMGFDNISSTATPGGNVFINSSSSVTAATIQTWLNGDSFPTTGVRRTYIGIAKGGTGQVALIPGITRGFDPDPLYGDNGFCPVTYTADDIHSAGYPSTGYVFTYPAAWIDTTAVTDPDVEVDATYNASTAGIYQSGFWNDPANTAAGVGKAAMVSYEPEGATAHGRVVLMGFHPLYRAQPEGNYLLVARQILLAASTPPSTPLR